MGEEIHEEAYEKIFPSQKTMIYFLLIITEEIAYICDSYIIPIKLQMSRVHPEFQPDHPSQGNEDNSKITASS